MQISLFPLLACSISSALLYALRAVFAKLAGTGMVPSEMLMWQGAVGCIIIGFYAWTSKSSLMPVNCDTKIYAMRVLFGIGSLLFMFIALNGLPAAVATTFFFSAPLFLTILSPIFINEKLTKTQIFSIFFGFSGVCLATIPGMNITKPIFLFAGVASGLCNGIMRIYVKKMTLLNEPSWRGVFWLSVLSFVCGLTWIIFFDQDRLFKFHSTPFMFDAFIAATATLVAQVLALIALKYGPTAIVGGLSFIAIPLTAILGMMLLHEHLSSHQVVGLAITLCACVILSGGGLARQFRLKEPLASYRYEKGR